MRWLLALLCLIPTHALAGLVLHLGSYHADPDGSNDTQGVGWRAPLQVAAVEAGVYHNSFGCDSAYITASYPLRSWQGLEFAGEAGLASGYDCAGYPALRPMGRITIALDQWLIGIVPKSEPVVMLSIMVGFDGA